MNDPIWAHWSGLFFVLLALPVFRGYAPLVRRMHNRQARFLSMLIMGVSIVLVSRVVWWDLGPLLGGDVWRSFRRTLGGLNMNTVFNALGALCFAGFLYLRWLLIPEPERSKWRWYTAWAHPGNYCIIPWRRK